MAVRYKFLEIVRSQTRTKFVPPYLFWKVACPLAWPITYIMANMGVRPNSATSLRLVLAILSFGLMLTQNGLAYDLAVGIFFIAVLLDNVDGQLARVLDAASYFGKMYDGIVDSILDVGLPFILGIHVYLFTGDIAGIIYGATASLSHAMVQLVMVRCSLATAVHRLDKGAVPFPHVLISTITSSGVYRIVGGFFEKTMPSLIWDFRIGGLAISFVFGKEIVFLVLMAWIQLVMFLGLSFFRLIRIYPQLDVYRLSSTAHRPTQPITKKR